MARGGYGVLAARVLEGRSERDAGTQHHQIVASGGGVEFRVAVNVLSQQVPRPRPRRSGCSTRAWTKSTSVAGPSWTALSNEWSSVRGTTRGRIHPYPAQATRCNWATAAV